MKYVALALLLLLPACSLVPVTAKQKLASGVNDYCKRITYTERSILRAEVNAITAPNSIKVTCGGDPE
jgi:hypothetical protein